MGAFELLVELATKAQPETVAEKAAAEKARLSEGADLPTTPVITTQDKEELEAAELLQSMKTARVSLKALKIEVGGAPGAGDNQTSVDSEKAITPVGPGKRPKVRIPKVAKPDSLRQRLAKRLKGLEYLANVMLDEADEAEIPGMPVEVSIVEEEVVGVDVTAYDFVDDEELMDITEQVSWKNVGYISNMTTIHKEQCCYNWFAIQFTL